MRRGKKMIVRGTKPKSLPQTKVYTIPKREGIPAENWPTKKPAEVPAGVPEKVQTNG